MKFSKLSTYFKRISDTSSRLEITKILSELFRQLSFEELEKVIYLLQGRVRPAYEGIDFGMAERTIVKSSILALNIDKGYFERELKKIGDLGATVENFKNSILRLKKERWRSPKFMKYFFL